MLFKKDKADYDRESMTPALHFSICTGEKVAGFIDNETGKFRDVMLIKSDKELNRFLKLYGINKKDLKSDY